MHGARGERLGALQPPLPLQGPSVDPERLAGAQGAAPSAYENTKVDVTSAPGLGALMPMKVPTEPIEGQKPGTSGLRKKTQVFMRGNYLHNFVQSTFNTVKASGADMGDKTLVVGGDGRYFNPEAIQIIIKMAVANGISHIAIGQDGLLSTPAVSAVIRERGPSYMKSFGAFILTPPTIPAGLRDLASSTMSRTG